MQPASAEVATADSGSATEKTATTCTKHAGLVSGTAFRVVEKKYRLYKPDPRQVKKGRVPEATEQDFTAVVDARDLANNTADNRRMIHEHRVPRHPGADSSGDDEMAKAVMFDGVPGLVIFPQFLTVGQQQAFCFEALTDFVSTAHPNNVSTLKPEYAAGDGYEAGIRWSTLGYSYNWTTREYTPSEKTGFPTSVARFCSEAVALLPLVNPELASVSENYDPQTAIVNFYPSGTSMCAHQDLSEKCLHRPLVSLSLGSSCIFLMGTESRDDPPHAFWLRSGDVAVFTGPSRLAFHGVPRVFDDTPKWLMEPSRRQRADEGEVGDESFEKQRRQLAKLQGLRININVRQVFDPPLA